MRSVRPWPKRLGRLVQPFIPRPKCFRWNKKPGGGVSGSFGECQAETIVAGCDPYRLADLVGDALPGSFHERLQGCNAKAPPSN